MGLGTGDPAGVYVGGEAEEPGSLAIRRDSRMADRHRCWLSGYQTARADLRSGLASRRERGTLQTILSALFRAISPRWIVFLDHVNLQERSCDDGEIF